MHRFLLQLLIFVVLQIVTLGVYHWVPGIPLWSEADIGILHDAIAGGQLTLQTMFQLGYVASQPLLNFIFMIQHKLWGLDTTGYLYMNLVTHACNAFLVSLLVRMLFSRLDLALLSGLLFAMSIGNYGKTLLTISGFESLFLSTLYLLVLYCLIRDDFKSHSRINSSWFILGVVIFLLAGLTKPEGMSILGCLLAYKFLFFKERGQRAIFSPNLLILIGVGFVFYLAQHLWGYSEPRPAVPADLNFVQQIWYPLKNIFRYLNLLVFPMQVSDLLKSAHPTIQLIYDWRLVIRTVISLGIISFSFFGLVFGSKALRFFIVWTFITVFPFALMQKGNQWLNLSYLYLSSVGFCVVISVGAIGCYNLLKSSAWKRYLPFLIPAFFIVLSLTINYRLARRYRILAQSPQIVTMRALLSGSGNGGDAIKSSETEPK